MREIRVWSEQYDCYVDVIDRWGTIVDKDGNEIGEVDMRELMAAPHSEWEDIIEEALRQ